MSNVISQIHLENFRAFAEPTTIPLRKITLLYGQNSAGKSSIIKSLLMIQQTLDGAAGRSAVTRRGFIFSGESVDLGSFSGTVTDHDITRSITVGLTLARFPNLSPSALTAHGVSLKWRIGAEDGQLSTLIRIADSEMLFRRWKRQSDNYFVLDPESVPAWADIATRRDDLFSSPDPLVQDLAMGVGYVPVFTGHLIPHTLVGVVAMTGQQGGLPNPAVNFQRYRDSTHDNDDSLSMPRGFGVRAEWEEIGTSLNRALRANLRELSYVGPLRQEPQRFERYVPSMERTVGSTGEHMLSVLIDRPNVLLDVNNYLSSMELPYRIKVERLGAQEAVGAIVYLALVNHKTGLEVSPSDVGVGYSQILPLIAQAVLSRNSVVCVEQPELHLHPAMQARLGDMFIDQAKGGNNVQFVIETHSESLMLRILRRIREGKIGPDDVQVLYVDQDANGRSVVHDLPIHESGDFLTPWPNGFFDERLEEIGF